MAKSTGKLNAFDSKSDKYCDSFRDDNHKENNQEKKQRANT